MVILKIAFDFLKRISKYFALQSQLEEMSQEELSWGEMLRGETSLGEKHMYVCNSTK